MTQNPWIQPYFIGRGASAKALSRALALLPTVDPELAPNVRAPIQLERGARLAEVGAELARTAPGARAVLFVANPHALHAARLLEAQAAGFAGVLCEKPVGVTLDELARLEREVRIPVAVCHGYRMMWGPQTLRELVAAGQVGEAFALDGHYLQSSAASRALSGQAKASNAWKNDPALSGPHDCLLDLAPHWVDLAAFVGGNAVVAGRKRLGYANSEAPHRDTHVTLDFAVGAVPARATISKTTHGADNDLLIRVSGSRATLTWSFQRPDEIEIGEGSDVRLLRRKDARYGILQAPFHGAGWIEGYFEVTRRFLREIAGLSAGAHPTLGESAAVMRMLLSPEA